MSRGPIERITLCARHLRKLATLLLVWAALLRAPASMRAPAPGLRNAEVSDGAGDEPSPLRRLLQRATRARAAILDDRADGEDQGQDPNEDLADAIEHPVDDGDSDDAGWPLAAGAPML